jgi:hypothetical protein
LLVWLAGFDFDIAEAAWDFCSWLAVGLRIVLEAWLPVLFVVMIDILCKVTSHI